MEIKAAFWEEVSALWPGASTIKVCQKCRNNNLGYRRLKPTCLVSRTPGSNCCLSSAFPIALLISERFLKHHHLSFVPLLNVWSMLNQNTAGRINVIQFVQFMLNSKPLWRWLWELERGKGTCWPRPARGLEVNKGGNSRPSGNRGPLKVGFRLLCGSAWDWSW